MSNNSYFEVLENQLKDLNARTMSQQIADETKAALKDLRRAKRLIAKAEATLSRTLAFYAEIKRADVVIMSDEELKFLNQ